MTIHIADRIQARHLLVPIDGAEFARVEERAGLAAKRLATLGYDQAPVAHGEDVIGFVLRRDLEGHRRRIVRNVAKAIEDENTAALDEPLAFLLDGLARHEFLFVTDEARIVGFITPSDLNKHPARAHFFLLLSAFEMGLAELIRRRIDGDPMHRWWVCRPIAATNSLVSTWPQGMSVRRSTSWHISCSPTCFEQSPPTAGCWRRSDSIPAPNGRRGRARSTNSGTLSRTEFATLSTPTGARWNYQVLTGDCACTSQASSPPSQLLDPLTPRESPSRQTFGGGPPIEGHMVACLLR
jgi:hypothetical protein